LRIHLPARYLVLSEFKRDTTNQNSFEIDFLKQKPPQSAQNHIVHSKTRWTAQEFSINYIHKLIKSTFQLNKHLRFQIGRKSEFLPLIMLVSADTLFNWFYFSISLTNHQLPTAIRLQRQFSTFLLFLTSGCWMVQAPGDLDCQRWTEF
jgi:hypothetical protein